jgi:putative ABC transport system permease protein
MPDRKMFWRIVRRLFAAQRGRLLVILMALAASAALTAALLNLQVDARDRLTKEFRVFGANIIVAPRETKSPVAGVVTLDESIIEQVRRSLPPYASADSYLYLVASVSVANASVANVSSQPVNAVIAGKRTERIDQSSSRSAIVTPRDNKNLCSVGVKAAQQLHLQPDDRLTLKNDNKEETCVSEIAEAHGDAQDSQIIVNLDAAQRLASLPGKVSLIQVSVPGTPRQIRDYIAALAQNIPAADVHGLRQFTDAEAKIYTRVSGLLTATTALVLALTGLCVMAAMTNVAMERKNDVGLMKAMGGATRRVLRLFLAEAALLGLAGGVVGAAAGLLLSIWLGKTVFGVAARPRLIVYPVSVALSILVAIVSSYPLRRLANISPASVFRGEA